MEHWGGGGGGGGFVDDFKVICANSLWNRRVGS